MQESQQTDFKRLWKDDYLKWICAFANSNGGTNSLLKEQLLERYGQGRGTYYQLIKVDSRSKTIFIFVGIALKCW